MARFNGANLRYDNSDETERTYDLSAEVVVNGNKAESVQGINIAKDGMNFGYGNISGIGSGNASANFNIDSLPADEIKHAVAAMADFALGLVAKAEEDGV